MDRQPVRSVMIRSVGYDPERHTLEVEFSNGSVHEYPGVLPNEHQALLEAPSIGSHFHQHFRAVGRAHRQVGR